MRVLQVLPALYSGGVERGTVEFAAELVRRGHESYVVSRGGPKIRELSSLGSHHITLPVHRKSLASFGQILPMRQVLKTVQPDVVHVRSRMPAWITRLAWKGLPADRRPALVSTFHGMYSVNPYSAVMAKADQVIAVSECVKDYILANYPVPPERLTVIQRGVDVASFRPRPPDPDWLTTFYHDFPHLRDKKLVLMPGRISRWKGQRLFLEAMAKIVRQRPDCHGLIVGLAEPGKERFLQELEAYRGELGLEHQVTFAGHRTDMPQLYLAASVVCHLSTKPEPFGRTVTEALASGTPVAAFDRGGAAETLQACFPEGLVTPDDTDDVADRVIELMTREHHPIEVPERFHLKAQVDTTLDVYRRALDGG